MTTKYHQHAPTLLKNPKNHDILTIVCRKGVKVIFPLRCSHFIFLDETAVGYPCNSVDFCEVTDDSVDSGVTELGDSGENCDSGYLIILVKMPILVIS